ncbi:hypothetical protein NUW54_g14781 [Trametes sanguinea]|uniref:Uncharacterized protein n=1 Tax=Trametes sanguinea TaxID=158606 RepID=A0ACC1MA96_9APHY|nr:hypothetical protein NUW54_g14781 [Trametes sanguinea]
MPALLLRRPVCRRSLSPSTSAIPRHEFSGHDGLAASKRKSLNRTTMMHPATEQRWTDVPAAVVRSLCATYSCTSEAACGTCVRIKDSPLRPLPPGGELGTERRGERREREREERERREKGRGRGRAGEDEHEEIRGGAGPGAAHGPPLFHAATRALSLSLCFPFIPSPALFPSPRLLLHHHHITNPILLLRPPLAVASDCPTVTVTVTAH